MSVYEQRAWINVILANVIDDHATSIIFLVVATMWATVWIIEKNRHGN